MANQRALLVAFMCASTTLACGGADTSFSNGPAPATGEGGAASGGASASTGGTSGAGGGANGGASMGGGSGAGGAANGGATSGGAGGAANGGSANGGASGAGGVANGGAANGGAANGGTAGAGGAANGGVANGGASGAGGAANGGAANGGTAGAGGVAAGGAGGAGGAAGSGGVGGVDGGALGTYVSGTVGDDTNPGTQALPVQTIAKGIANAQTLGGGVPVFVAEGHYPEKVTLVEGINLLGGHQCAVSSCTWARDPMAHDTAILDQDAEGVLANDTVTRATTIDGFRIMGQNGGTTGRGRVSVTLRGGSPTFTNNRVFGATVQGGTGPSGRSIAVLIAAPSNSAQGALIENNDIGGGQASDQSIAIAFENFGASGASSAATIRKNQIRGGAGSSSAAISAVGTTAATLVEDNDITTGSASSGQAWAVNVFSQMTINGNRINVGNTTTACQSGNQNPCGGINSLSSTTTITNNVVFGVDAPRSIGVRLTEAEVPGGAVILNSNTIDGGGTQSNSGSGTSMSAALQVEIGACTACGFNGFVGHIRNNVLLGGVANARFSIYEQAPSGRTQHPDMLENNDLYVEPPLSANDALYRYYDGANATLITSIANVNALQTQVARMTVGNNISGDPMLDASFNLLTGSPCIDKGTSTEAPALDKNGLARPQNALFDVGADEF